MNLHTPERHSSETRAKYRERQSESRFAVQRMTRTGPYRPPSHKEPNSRERFRRDRDFSKRVRFADALMAHWAALGRRTTN